LQLKERYAHFASRQLPVEPDLQMQGKEVLMEQAFLVLRATFFVLPVLFMER
jgi:hypothetical protein